MYMCIYIYIKCMYMNICVNVYISIYIYVYTYITYLNHVSDSTTVVATWQLCIPVFKYFNLTSGALEVTLHTCMH